MRLILASASPRRRELLAGLGLTFEVMAPDADESFPANTSPAQVPELLAIRKADLIFRQYPDALVLAADTVVDCDNQILNKPASEEEAIEMLQLLSGKMHLVHSGYCLKCHGGLISGVCTTAVYFRPLEDSEISWYVSNHQVLDKAGAYGIQDWIGLAAAGRIDGSYFNVMGLPTHVIWQALRQLKFPLPDNT